MKEVTHRLQTEDAIWVSVDAAQGSVPREPGAWMAVFADAVFGTVGGGHLEHQAIAEARRRLTGGSGEPVLRYPPGRGFVADTQSAAQAERSKQTALAVRRPVYTLPWTSRSGSRPDPRPSDATPLCSERPRW